MPFNRVTRGNALVGALNVGAGTNIKEIQSGSVAIDFPAASANNYASATFTVTGAAVGDIVLLSTSVTPAASFTIQNVGVTAANTAVVQGFNHGAASVNPAEFTAYYLWLDVT